MIKVEIIETLSRTIEIDAKNEMDAINVAKDLYKHEAIILGSEDYVDTEFKIVEERRS